MEIKPIAVIKTDFDSKFGIPRQSRRAETIGTVVFEKEYRSEDYIKGIEQFSHLWLIWEFSKNTSSKINATVRPPRLGGNKRVGVFASRSPYRPNSLGLSCVKLMEIVKTENGCELIVSGADLMNGTPIYDIKPYIPYTDCVEDADGGYAEDNKEYSLKVDIDEALLNKIPREKQKALLAVLKDDPRPAYQNDSERVYGFPFAGFEIKFKVSDNVLTVVEIE